MANDLDVNAKEFLVEDELSKRSMAVEQLLECGSLSGNVALSLVLFFQELTSEVVDQL